MKVPVRKLNMYIISIIIVNKVASVARIPVGIFLAQIEVVSVILLSNLSWRFGFNIGNYVNIYF